jgi:thiamine-phosphate pyrophosphorylase
LAAGENGSKDIKMLARARLARAAATLNACAQADLPPLVLMTDDERLIDPIAAARALPRGSMVIVRARQSSHRAKLATELRAVARRRGLVLLVANDAVLADRIGAAGIHLSQFQAPTAAHWRALRPRWLITAAAHSLAASARAQRNGADAVVLGPIFQTRSHPGRPTLGAARARLLARQLPGPAYALGGIDGRNGALLGGFAGLAAVGALAYR